MSVNIKLLKKVRKLIADEPKRLLMTSWGRLYDKRETKLHPVLPACGTVACLAGWTVLASQPKRTWAKLFTEPVDCGFRYNPGESDIPNQAAKLLGIPRKDCPFWAFHWGAPQVLAWIDEQIAKAK